MGGLKKPDGGKKKSSEGDLFPRGAAPSATPRIRKRDGQVLFAPPSKRARLKRPSIDETTAGSDPSDGLGVTRHGAMLSASRLSPGMTLLALVVRADKLAVNVVLPSGIHATADPQEALVVPESDGRAFVRREDSDESESESEGDSEWQSEIGSEGSEEQDDDAVAPLWQTVHVGQVVRVALLSVDRNDHGRRTVRVSFKPDLLNVGLKPAHVLSKGFPVYAAVRSVEDHGYVLSFGAHIQATGFLPFDKWQPHDAVDGKEAKGSGCDGNRLLFVGQPVEVVVEQDVALPEKQKGKNFTGVIQVSAIRENVLAATVSVTEQLNYHELRAGMLVPAKAMKEGPGGVALTAFGVFSISVDASHVPRSADGTWDIKMGKQTLARILYVDASQKLIGASLLDSYVIKLLPPRVPTGWKIGAVMKKLRVEQVKPGYGLIMSWVSSGEDGKRSGGDVNMNISDEDVIMLGDEYRGNHIPIFAHISRVSDSKDLRLESNYHKDMIVTQGARVVSVSRFDGIVNVDLRPSILSRKALSLDEIEIGSLYDCRVMSHTTLGSLSVAVDCDTNLQGIVPKMHVSDVSISSRLLAQHENLRVGAKLKCRAIYVDFKKGKVFLSAKKSIVSPKYPVLTSLEQANDKFRAARSNIESEGPSVEAVIFSGSVSRVLESGSVVISFCGQVAGLVPKSELCLGSKSGALDSQSDVELIYPVGQTVFVRITGVNVKLRRLWLSMDLKLKKDGRRQVPLQLGQLIDGRVTKIDDVANHIVVSVKVISKRIEGSGLGTKHAQEGDPDEEEIDCHLPYGHLGDTHGMTERVASELSKALNLASQTNPDSGLLLKELMVLSTRDLTPILTMKQSLKDAAAANIFPKCFEDVAELAQGRQSKNQSQVVLRGYVKALLPSGVIIGFLGNAVGFVRKSRIADHFVSDPSRVLKINQSVSAAVDSIDGSNKRFQLSLRLSDVGNDGLADETLSLFKSFEQWRRILDLSSLESKFSIGSILNAEVETRHTYGVTFKLESDDRKALGVSLDVSNADVEIPKGEGITWAENLGLSSKKTRKKKYKKSGRGQEFADREQVRVIDIDPFSEVVDVARDENVIAGGAKKSILHVDSTFSATVLLVKSSYIVLAVARSKSRTAIAFAVGPTVSDNLEIRPGTQVQCRVLDKSVAQTRRNLVVVDWQAFRERSAKTVKNVKAGESSDYSTTLSLLRESNGENERAVVGKKLSGKVTKNFPLHVFVGIAQGLVGQIHVTNVDFLSESETAELALGLAPRQIASRFQLPQLGSRVGPAYIAGVRRSSEKQLSAPIVVELSLSERRQYFGDVSEGQKFLGFVKNLSSRMAKVSGIESTGTRYSYTRVAIGPSTTVSCTDVNSLFEDRSIPLAVGSPVIVQITAVEKSDTSRLQGTISENGKNPHDFFNGIVQDVDLVKGVRVGIPWLASDGDFQKKSWGIVALSDISGDYDEVSLELSKLKKGDIIRVRKLEVASIPSSSSSMIWLSMRDVDDTGRDQILTAEDVSSLRNGTKVRGIVTAIGRKGCFVCIGRGITAHVKLCDLADDFVKEPEKEFPVGKVVEGTVQNEQASMTQVSLVLRKRPRKSLTGGPTIADLKEGSEVSGTVKRVEAFGALLEISKDLTALLHKSEAEQDRFIENPAKEWAVGQRLTAIVIRVSKKGVQVGTKRCYFEAAGFSEIQIAEFLNGNHSAQGRAASMHEEVEANLMDIDVVKVDIHDEVRDIMSEKIIDQDESADEIDVAMQETTVSDDKEEMVNSEEWNKMPVDDDDEEVPALDIGVGFEFEEATSLDISKTVENANNPNDMESARTASAPDAEKKTSREKREKKRMREASEKAIRLREEALAKNPDAPETAADFERLLVGEPNCSVLWIRYMAFCLSLHQVDKARSVAERALDTISLSEESHRSNIWMAYLNLEAQYGAANSVSETVSDNLGLHRDAAVFRVFDRACERVTDVEKLHLQAAAALRDTSTRIADEILHRASRKFKRSSTVWIAIGEVQFKSGDKKSGRRTLERALAGLEETDHVRVISKFAQFEYKYGSSERGRTVFESLVSNFPKRLDLWNVYLDMETNKCREDDGEERQQMIDSSRNLFEKCTALDWSSKKMKSVFQKWLTFEKRFGTKQHRKEVKEKARQYVERSVAAKV